VDDFGIKYVNEDNKNHLVGVLCKKYKISEDLTGNKYCGMHTDWDYKAGTCDISMPSYIERALERFQHNFDGTPQNAPQPHDLIEYGAKVQYAAAPDESPILEGVRKSASGTTVLRASHRLDVIGGTRKIGIGTSQRQ
jgi:hypothetical protein